MSYAREHLFISYCREDRRWLEKFEEMLAPLIRKEQFKIWDDSKITPGSKWFQEIEKAVDTSKVALLLVSARFLASDFIMEHELPLLNAARSDGLTVLWVGVSRCMYQYTDLADYQALNDPAKTLDSLAAAKLNDEMVRMCKLIKKFMDGSLQVQGQQS